MRTGRGFGMILHAEDRQFFMAHAFDRAVVEIHVRHFDFVRQTCRIDSEAVILRSDRDLAAA